MQILEHSLSEEQARVAPHDLSVVQAALRETGVERARAFVALDGRRLAIVVRQGGPAALVRVEKALGLRGANRWSATSLGEAEGVLHAVLPAGLAPVVVERTFDPALELSTLERMEARSDWCRDVYGVQRMCTLVSADRSRMLCVFGALDADSVRHAQRSVELPLDRVWPALPAVPAEAPAPGSAVGTASAGAGPGGWLSLFDTSLRDGLTGWRVDPAARLACLELIDALGVDVIEVGMASDGGAAIDPIAACVERVSHATVCALAHPEPAAMAAAGAALAGARRARLHVYNAVSDAASIAGKPTALGERRLREIRRTVERAREHVEDVQWSALDATRGQPSFVAQALEVAIDAGAQTVGIPDTRGHALPAEISGLWQMLSESVEGFERVGRSVHCHDDLGLATANTLAAIACGATQVEGTVGGLGPQGGNSDLQALCRLLSVRTDIARLAESVRHSGFAAIDESLKAMLR